MSSWRVKEGMKVSHDGTIYSGGDTIPVTDEQALTMLHAVEQAGVSPSMKPTVAVVVDEAPHDEGAVTPKAHTKRGK